MSCRGVCACVCICLCKLLHVHAYVKSGEAYPSPLPRPVGYQKFPPQETQETRFLRLHTPVHGQPFW